MPRRPFRWGLRHPEAFPDNRDSEDIPVFAPVLTQDSPARLLRKTVLDVSDIPHWAIPLRGTRPSPTPVRPEDVLGTS